MDNGSFLFGFFVLPLGLGLFVGCVIVALGAALCLAWAVNRLTGLLVSTIASRLRARRAESRDHVEHADG